MTLSIIVPVCNVAPYLRECLDSVRTQTSGDWQCICVDDGSTDGSGDILDEYHELDSRIEVIHQTNQGVSSARNNGLKIAKGEWVGFLDGDDIWSPYTVELLLEVVRKHVLVDVVAFYTKAFPEKGALTRWNRPTNFEPTVLDMRYEYPSSKETEMFFGGKIYRRKKVVGANTFPNYRNGEDLVFLFACLLSANYMAIVPCEFYGYRQRQGSLSRGLVTVRFAVDHLNSTMDILRMLGRTDKHIEAGVVRHNVLKITEGMMLILSKLELTKTSYEDIWEQWKWCLGELISGNVLSGFQKMRVRIFLVCPLYITAWILFYIPVWLKSKGFHR